MPRYRIYDAYTILWENHPYREKKQGKPKKTRPSDNFMDDATFITPLEQAKANLKNALCGTASSLKRHVGQKDIEYFTNIEQSTLTYFSKDNPTEKDTSIFEGLVVTYIQRLMTSFQKRALAVAKKYLDAGLNPRKRSASNNSLYDIGFKYNNRELIKAYNKACTATEHIKKEAEETVFHLSAPEH